MRVDFHPEALEELISAAEWLDGEGEGMGDALLSVVDEVIARIRRFPYIGKQVPLRGLPAEVRQCVLRRYNYLLIYRIKGADTQIVALAHMRRRPGYWRRRVE